MGVIENLYSEKTKPEALKSTIGKLVCEGYRGPCEDITELDEEERHSSMHSSGVNASRGHRHCNSSNAKENNMNELNVKAFAKEKSSRYASSDSEPYAPFEHRRNTHAVFTAKEERQAVSTEIHAKEVKDLVSSEKCGRSLSNPMKKCKRTKVAENNMHDEYDMGKGAVRWVDPAPVAITTQRSSTNLKNDELVHLQKKLRTFEANKLFKRASINTCQSFTRNNNKSAAKLETKCGSATSESKQQGKAMQSRYKSALVHNSNSKAVALRSFEYPAEHNSVYRSVTLRRTNTSRSRDSERRAR